MVERRLADIDFAALIGRGAFPSPAAWEDQILYMVMVDRFSDGREQGYFGNDGALVEDGTTPPFTPEDAGGAASTNADAARWYEAGGRFCGGTLRGVQSKLGYLKRLGVTTICLSPVLRQNSWEQSYHGYATQNFLDVDPRFGTRDDLQNLVRAAHDLGLYVILDIVFGYTADTFMYAPDRYLTAGPDGGWYLDPRWDGQEYRVAGFRDQDGRATLPFGPIDVAARPDAWPNGAVWPAELQQPETYVRRGYITNWSNDPEFRQGDLFTLKRIHLGAGRAENYRPSAALAAMVTIYRFWMAYADLDGFRINGAQHMDAGAVRMFTHAIHEFAQKIGKEHFYLIGAVGGDQQRAFQLLEQSGLDAAIGPGNLADLLEHTAKGTRNPCDYFDLFQRSRVIGTDPHTWLRNRVVTLFDDHDQTRKGYYRARFCADPGAEQLLPAGLALNVLTLGIPSIYYGTEQCFDGNGPNDRYLRESMFGGPFGAFQSSGRHFFNEQNPAYQVLKGLLAVRQQHLALRRGRQYLRPISTNGNQFNIPEIMGGRLRSVLAWSRLHDVDEIVCAINTDTHRARGVWVMVDGGLHRQGAEWHCIYATDPDRMGVTASTKTMDAGYSAIFITVPPCGVVIYRPC